MSDLVVIFLALALGSFIKGLTGAGLPQIAIPVMAIFLGVERAVIVMAIPGALSNGYLLWHHRAHLRATRDLPPMLAAGVVGSVLGTWLLKTLDARTLSLVLAGIITIYLILFVTNTKVILPPTVSRYLSPPVGFAAGALQGSTGIAGPLLSTYLHAFRLPKQVFVVSLVTLFSVLSTTQVITLFSVGLYTQTRVAESLLALLPMLLFLPLGARTSRRLSTAMFDRVMVGVLFLSAVKLIVDSL